MKTTTKLSILTLAISVMFIAAKPVNDNKLTGTWKLVSAETDGKTTPPAMLDRTQEFRPDQTFEGLINIQNSTRQYNEGKFFLPNDTTIITLHADKSGKFYKTAFTYNFQIKNDSLHLYGEFLVPVPGNPAFMRKVYINEWWVKSASLSE